MMDSVGIEPSLTESQIQKICKSWLPIYWSTKDTDESIVGIKVNNVSRTAFCATEK